MREAASESEERAASELRLRLEEQAAELGARQRKTSELLEASEARVCELLRRVGEGGGGEGGMGGPRVAEMRRVMEAMKAKAIRLLDAKVRASLDEQTSDNIPSKKFVVHELPPA